MGDFNGVNIFGPVIPYNTNDIYATHKATFGQGGWRSVLDLNERDAIPYDRREDLMVVAVQDNSYTDSTSGVAFYLLDVNGNQSTSTSILDNLNWYLLDLGYGNDGWVFPAPNQSIYNGKKGQRSFDDTYLYICVENNEWKRTAIDWFVNGANGTSGTNGINLNIGDVGVWDGSGWDYEILVKDVESVESTSGNLKITLTDNSFKIIEVGGDRWILPAPLSSVWSGVEGDRSYDDKYFYVCVQENLWKRVAYDFFVFGASTSGISGNFFSLPDGFVPIWDTTTNTWIFNRLVSDVNYNGSNSTLNITFSDDQSTSFIIHNKNNLSELNDVLLTNSTSGQILTYNGSKWINELFPGIKWVFPSPNASVYSGKKGDLSYDDNFVYVCIETDTWKRINIDFFTFSPSTSGGLILLTGSVPVWNGSEYDNEILVKKVEPYILGGLVGELITYTNGATTFIDFSTSGNINGTNGIITSNTTSGNGLSMFNNNTVILGGTLFQDTTIDLNNFNFKLRNNLSDTANFLTGKLYGIMEVESIDYYNRYLKDSVGRYSIDYENRHLKDVYESVSINWNLHKTYDGFTQKSIDWDTRDLIAPNGTTVIANWYNGALQTSILPTNAYDVINKTYLDNLITGLNWKQSVVCATTIDITLIGEQLIDNITTNKSRVLVKNQLTATENGIYLSSTSGWVRTIDADISSEILGSTVFVEAGGSINGNTQWSNSNTSILLGSTNISYVQIAGAGVYTNGSGITLLGNVFSIANGAITNAMLAGSIDLTTKVTGVLPSANGGTGVNNGSSTITLGGNLITSGSNGLTLTSTATTNVTLPTSGTLYGTSTGSITSAQLATSLTDETGTGFVVFSISPALTGTPTTPTQLVTDNSTAIATTAWVRNYVVSSSAGSVSTFSFTNANGFTGTVSNPTTTPTLSLVLQDASISQSGQLTSTDWNTFNNKQNTITLTTNGSNGSSTLISNTLNIPTYTLQGLGGQTQLNGTGFVKISGTTISYDNSTYLTSNQTITLSGDISGSGTTAITTTIDANKVTYSKIQQIPTKTLLGNSSSGTSNVEPITIGSNLTLDSGILSATNKNLFVATSTRNYTVASPAIQADTTLFGTGIGTTTLSANSVQIGDEFIIKLKGYIDVTATATFTLNIKIGSTTISTQPSIVISAPKTQTFIDLEFSFNVRTIGSSGTVIGNGCCIFGLGGTSAPVFAQMIMTSTSTIDFTTSQIVDATISWTSGFTGAINITQSLLKLDR